MSQPSAFVDSPEDLIRRAKALDSEIGVPPKVAILVVDLARALEKERADRVSTSAMLRSLYEDKEILQNENDLLRAGPESARVLKVIEETQEAQITAGNLATALGQSRARARGLEVRARTHVIVNGLLSALVFLFAVLWRVGHR